MERKDKCRNREKLGSKNGYSKIRSPIIIVQKDKKTRGKGKT